MSEKEIATILLYERANKIVNFPTLHPKYIVEMVKDFLCNGCKSRRDYETIIMYMFINDGFNRDLLLSL